MRVLELFSGTGVLSAAFRERGHRTLTVDWSEALKPDWNADIGKLTADEIVARFGHPDVIWASPDCTTYSVMCISRHRDGTKPKSEYAARCDSVNAHVCDLIRQLKPKVWFVENPVGMLRKMPFILGLLKDTGGSPPCKRGAPCHDAAPRGSRTGTQGLKGKALRAKLPAELCRHIVAICESIYS